MSAIGTLNEGSLHAALKAHYARPGDAFEVPHEGFVIDIVRDAGGPAELFIEIQTGSFRAMGRKLDRLLEAHRIKLVYPVALRTVLERDGRRRASPKKGSVYSLFDELVSIPTLLDHPSLELDLVSVEVTKHQVPDPRARRGRGGWRTVDRQLDAIVDVWCFTDMVDVWRLVTGELPDRFTTAHLAGAAGVDRGRAQQMAYCFNAANLIDQVGRTRDGKIYRVTL
ncbi:MAG: hypothetical protein HKN93_11955 [Acidimicrobiia bacterium]|nr:hypothetical protein [Acidimicrobiia bacterium]